MNNQLWTNHSSALVAKRDIMTKSWHSNVTLKIVKDLFATIVIVTVTIYPFVLHVIDLYVQFVIAVLDVVTATLTSARNVIKIREKNVPVAK